MEAQDHLKRFIYANQHNDIRSLKAEDHVKKFIYIHRNNDVAWLCNPSSLPGPSERISSLWFYLKQIIKFGIKRVCLDMVTWESLMKYDSGVNGLLGKLLAVVDDIWVDGTSDNGQEWWKQHAVHGSLYFYDCQVVCQPTNQDLDALHAKMLVLKSQIGDLAEEHGWIIGNKIEWCVTYLEKYVDRDDRTIKVYRLLSGVAAPEVWLHELRPKSASKHWLLTK